MEHKKSPHKSGVKADGKTFMSSMGMLFFSLLCLPVLAQNAGANQLPYSSIIAFNFTELIDSVEKVVEEKNVKRDITDHLVDLGQFLGGIENPDLLLLFSGSDQFFFRNKVGTLSFSLCCEESEIRLDTIEVVQERHRPRNKSKQMGYRREFTGIYSNRKASIIALLDIFSWKDGSHKTYEFTVGQANLIAIRESYVKE